MLTHPVEGVGYVVKCVDMGVSKYCRCSRERCHKRKEKSNNYVSLTDQQLL